MNQNCRYFLSRPGRLGNATLLTLPLQNVIPACHVLAVSSDNRRIANPGLEFEVIPWPGATSKVPQEKL